MIGEQEVNGCDCCSIFRKNQVQLSEAEFSLLKDNHVEIDYKKNETIIKQGTFIDNIIILREGLIKIVIESDNGKDLIVKMVSPGQFVGLPALGMNPHYPVSAVALKKTKVCLIKADSVNDIARSNSHFAKYLLKWYSQDYQFLYHKMGIIGTKQMQGRLAEVLLYLNDEGFQKENIFSHITRNEIAALAGMSVESTNKILNELKNDKIIQYSGKKLEIKHQELLRRLSRYG